MVAAGFTSAALAHPGTTLNCCCEEEYEKAGVLILGIVQGTLGRKTQYSGLSQEASRCQAATMPH